MIFDWLSTKIDCPFLLAVMERWTGVYDVWPAPLEQEHGCSSTEGNVAVIFDILILSFPIVNAPPANKGIVKIPPHQQEYDSLQQLQVHGSFER